MKLVQVFTTATAVTALQCSNLVNMTGTADDDSWIITTANATSIGSVQYCHISATIGNRIRTWMQLPETSDWNGRYVQIGCGGACGWNPFENTNFDIATAIKKGYALGTTDMGVSPGDAFDPFHNNLQMRIDWGYLATHLTAVMSKHIITSYYGSSPKYSYHLGSSTGGRQSLVEAQRYPGEFNGVFAVAPAYNESGVVIYSVGGTAKAALQDETDFTAAITPIEAELLQNATLSQCDEMDGLRDGIISLPRLCKPDLSNLLCSNVSTSPCLSTIGAIAANEIYTGPISSVTGYKQVPEGFLPGSEASWIGAYISTTSGAPPAYSLVKSFLSFFAFWPDPIEPVTPLTINLSDPNLSSRISAIEDLVSGADANMTDFQQLGGKIIITGGLQDVIVAPGFLLDLYNRVGDAMGEDTRDEFMRFYELPGVGHVVGGPGADAYDALGYLAEWVENGTVPEVMVASHLDGEGNVAFTRPLFPFPFVAAYNGTGNMSDWRSYVPVNGGTEFWGI